MSDPASTEPGDIYRVTSGPQAGQPDIAAAVSTLQCAEELLQGVGKPLTAGMVSSARRTLVAALEAAQQRETIGTSGYYEEVLATQESLDRQCSTCSLWFALDDGQADEGDCLWGRQNLPQCLYTRNRTAATDGMRCSTWKPRLREVRAEEEGDDTQVCEGCSARVPFETMSRSGECWMCAPCTAAAAAEFHACEHRWEDGQFTEHRAGEGCGP